MAEKWQRIALGDVTDVIAMGPFGSSIKVETFTESGVPIISGSHLGRSQLKDGPFRYISNEHADRLAKANAFAGDVIFTHAGTLGQVSMVPRNTTWPRFVISQRQFLARCNESLLLPEFLTAFFLSPEGQFLLLANSGGSGVPSISQPVSYLRTVKIPVPKISEQQRIVNVLGALDDLIETNQNLMSALDELGMALFLDSWDQESWVPIEQLGQVTMGQSPPGETYNERGEGVVFYQGVRDFGDRYPTPRVHCTAPSRMADVGDILIAVRAPIGDTNVVLEPIAFGRGLASLRSPQPALALRALRAKERTWSMYQGTGTVFSSISGPDLKAALVPFVSEVNLEARLQVLDSMHAALDQEISDIVRTRDELLTLLMSGRVRVKELAG